MHLVSDSKTQVDGSSYCTHTIIEFDEMTSSYHVTQKIINNQTGDLFSQNHVVLTSPLSILFGE